MSGEKVINNLLENYAPLTAIVLTRIYPGVIPQGSILPAIAYTHVSTVENSTIDANAEYALVTSRIQVTVVTADYPALKNIINLVRQACNYKHGTIKGIAVNSIRRELTGPDFRDDEAALFMQSIDFKITYHELN